MSQIHSANSSLKKLTEPQRDLIGREERDNLVRVIDGIQAGKIKNEDIISEFENDFSQEIGTSHVVAVNSATSGLQIVLEASGLQPGHEVIVTPYTFAATAHAILAAGGRPVFADIDPNTLCLDVEDVRKKITSKTFAIMAVHIGGKSANMLKLLEVAKDRNIHVFEDAAQAHGATYRDKSVGTFGTAGVFSFGTKLITCLRGGAIVTDDESLARKCRSLAYHGINRSSSQLGYVHEQAGYNFQMTALQAALLIPQIKKMGDRFSRRYKNGIFLKKALESIPGIQVAFPEEGGTSNFYMLEILCSPNFFQADDKSTLVKNLQKAGLSVLGEDVIKSPIYMNPSLGEFATECPIAEAVYKKLIVLGHFMHSTLLDSDADTLNTASSLFSTVVRDTIDKKR